MAFTTISNIVSKMVDCPVLIRNWKQLADCLQVAESGYLGIENAFKNDTTTTYHLIRKILLLWLGNAAEKGAIKKTKANPKTVGELCAILKSRHLIACAESILELGPDCIIQSEEKPKPLCLGWWPAKKFLPESFVERGDDEGTLLVEKLDEMLKLEGRKAVISQQTCISGLGGIGKTTLAKRYAHRFEDSFDHIIWLDCGENSLASSFDRLWDGIHGPGNPQKPMALADKAKQCFEALDDGKTLFIYDNAEEYGGPTGIKDVIPRGDEFPKTTCLITSRCTTWGSRQGFGEIPQYRLQMLSDLESTALLKDSLENVESTYSDLIELSKTLGHHPLALQLAIANLNLHYANVPHGVGDYNKALHRSYDNLLVSSADLDDYEKRLKATLIETAMKVKGQNELGEMAWNLLCSFAHVLPSVPLKFLACVEKLSYEMAVQVSGLLRRYSLVELSGGGGNYDVVIHRLLQETVKHHCSSESSLYYSRIFNGEYDDEHLTFLWKPYCESDGRGILSIEELSAVKVRIYDSVTLDFLAWEEQSIEAEKLLDIYHEINQKQIRKCNTVQPHLQETLPGDAHTNECIISYLRGHVSYRLNNPTTLTYFSDAKRKALKLMELGVKTNALHGLFYYTVKTPKNWKMPNDWCQVLTHCGILMAQFLYQQNADDQAVEEVKDIAMLYKKNFALFSDLFPHTLKLGKVAHYFNEMTLYYITICYDGAKAWVQEYATHEFSECVFQSVRFKDPNGSVLENVDYHEVLPTKCSKLSIVSSQEGDLDCTHLTFDMSKVWSDTKFMLLQHCTVLWEPPSSACEIAQMNIEQPESIHCNHSGFWEMFPSLRKLSLSSIDLPLSFFPPFLIKLCLSNVDILDSNENGEEHPKVETLSLVGYNLESMFDITKQFAIQKLQIKNVLVDGKEVDKEEGCSLGKNCPIFRTIESVPQTRVSKPDSAFQAHLQNHGFHCGKENGWEFYFDAKN